MQFELRALRVLHLAAFCAACAAVGLEGSQVCPCVNASSTVYGFLEGGFVGSDSLSMFYSQCMWLFAVFAFKRHRKLEGLGLDYGLFLACCKCRSYC